MVDKGAQQDELAHDEPRRGYGRQAVQSRIEHPPRDLERTPMRLSDQDVVAPVMLVLADHQHGLADQRVKRVGDHGFVCQKPGTMAPARTAGRNAGRWSGPWSRPPS